MAVIRISLLFLVIGLSISCAEPAAQTQMPVNAPPTPPVAAVSMADRFAYPISDKEVVTQAKDSKDDWYNALDLGRSDHLGEDWNKNSGGNTDCGEPVYAAANGVITFAADAGPGWGNVVIIEHLLADRTKVQTLYAHLQEILKSAGDVKMREPIGKIGNANGRYLCHLHFEIRTQESRDWDRAGGGYSKDRTGWLDPSDFIDRQRRKAGR